MYPAALLSVMSIPLALHKDHRKLQIHPPSFATRQLVWVET
jgi:hypothetical protein